MPNFSQGLAAILDWTFITYILVTTHVRDPKFVSRYSMQVRLKRQQISFRISTNISFRVLFIFGVLFILGPIFCTIIKNWRMILTFKLYLLFCLLRSPHLSLTDCHCHHSLDPSCPLCPSWRWLRRPRLVDWARHVTLSSSSSHLGPPPGPVDRCTCQIKR